MAKINLKAQLTGVGSINNALIFLEDLPSNTNLNPLAIGLFPTNIERKEWSNDKISIEVKGLLDYQLKVNAYKGTKWTFKMSTLNDQGVLLKEIVNISGITGSDPNAKLNVSVVTDSVNIS